MRNRLLAVTARAVLSSFVMMAFAAPALALDRAPSAKPANNWFAIVAIIVLALGIAVGSFMSPRRGHLD